MKLLVMCIAALAVSACDDDGKSNKFVDKAETMSTLDCTETGRCNGIVAVDCHSATDGPLYYFDESSAALISVCGGACWTQDEDQRVVCMTMCPPPAFTDCK